MKRLHIISVLSFALLLIIACAHRPTFQFPIEQMRKPPGKLTVEQVPLFVSIGTDDNPYADGLNYLTELFGSRRNPPGDGNARNFDGQPLHYSFYVNTIYVTPNAKDDPEAVKQSWKDAIAHGDEIGVHTHSHPHGRKFSVEEWRHEIDLCMRYLTQPDGLGIPREQILGFRTPFLEYGDHTLTAVQHAGFVYDCSLEEGFQKDQDALNFVWPYSLDHGAPGNSATYKEMDLPLVRDHPGLLELPVYAFIVPPDDVCSTYGVADGFRQRMKQKNDYFKVEDGKITGMDWNLWFEYGMDKAEFLATLKYTLDRHLQGNRTPFMIGAHSWIYSEKNPEHPPKTTLQERRDALREFLDYALSKPEVRVVSSRELLDWLRSPAPLVMQASATTDSGPVRTAAQLGAGFRHLPHGVPNKTEPEPSYWARVAREMVARFPGSTPEVIWIVSRVKGRGTELSFPVSNTGDPLIVARPEDGNEAALRLFDQSGFRVWLQVEPGYTSVDKLLPLVLQQYHHHPSVVGFGVDIEWNQSTNPDHGEAVTDDQARAWLAAVRKFNPQYRLFLKHWETEKMPPTVREGILFVDDSQIFPRMQPMIDEFAQWGKAFAPSPVAFQIGYPSDRPWWSRLKDPPRDIGTQILRAVPNTEAVFWVDYSALEVFPPLQQEVKAVQ